MACCKAQSNILSATKRYLKHIIVCGAVKHNLSRRECTIYEIQAYLYPQEASIDPQRRSTHLSQRNYESLCSLDKMHVQSSIS